MHQNETTLTPIFRYIITRLEESDSTDNGHRISDIKDFIASIKRYNASVDLPMPTVMDETILDVTVSLLEQAECNPADAKTFWEKEISELENRNCENCQVCKQCSLYFWHELGQVLFQIENNYKRDKAYIPLRILPTRIHKHLEPSVNLKEVYRKKFLSERWNIEDYILILKGMSSSTPSILNSAFDTDEFDGGGFYINYHGIGIAVDPGYHFVRNLHHYGLNVLDIDLVVVTHEHIDHNNDMRLIDDLNRTVSDSHRLIWLMDKVSCRVAEIYQENETGFLKKWNLLISVEPGKEFRLSDYDDIFMPELDKVVQFVFFKTEHIFSADKLPKTHTFGCRFTFVPDDKCLVYTSDTRYSKELSEQIKYADIVIANISGVYEDDYMLVKPKERHLGYYGCFSILKDCYREYAYMPKLFMISEFWNGQNDIRYDVAKQMQENIVRIGVTDTRIVPAEKGMYVHIPDTHIRCSQCGKFSPKYLIKRPSALAEPVKVICLECYYE